jgi:hypothetical protein
MKKFVFAGILMVLIAAGMASAVEFSGDPNDEKFKCAENFPDKYWIFDEQFGLFSFAPDQSRHTAFYFNHPTDKGMIGRPQVSGSSIDLAWLREQGDPSVIIGVIECGVDWADADSIRKLYLNKGELGNYPPDFKDGSPVWDTNSDGRFSLKDYEPAIDHYESYKDIKDPSETRYRPVYKYTANGYNGHTDFFETIEQNGSFVVRQKYDPNKNGIFDPQDLILTYSNRADEDLNGFIDDICGWDFYEDDNDPEDTSSYSASKYHGRFELWMSSAEADNGIGVAGVCPNCTALAVRNWDTFAPDTSYYGLASLYAAKQGASVILGAIGGQNNSGVCRDVFKYIYERYGAALVMVSNDLNSADHNWPTHLNEAMFVSGLIGDTYVFASAFTQGPSPRIPVTTYFRNSNNTQYGAKAQICMEAPTGSEAVGLTSGSVGLIRSYAKRLGIELHPDQIKQLLCKWAEDVLPENTGFIGTPDPVKPGWDQHTGYGRPDINKVLEKIEEGKIPNIARITSPSWYAYLDAKNARAEIRGEILPSVSGKSITWKLEAGYGIEPDKFINLSSGSGTGSDMLLANMNLDEIDRKIFLANGIDIKTFPNETEKKMPWEAGIQPNRDMFTVRLTVSDGDGDTQAEDRRAFFLCRDSSLHQGWPVYIGAGGEQAIRLEDLDGDNLKEVVAATSDGRILIFTHDGKPYAVGGNVVEFRAEPMSHTRNHPGFEVPGKPLLPAFTTPAIGDIDRDGIKEIIAVAEGMVYCFKANGGSQRGFPVSIGKYFWEDKASGLLSRTNTIGHGATAEPVLHDLNKDGRLDVIVASADQRVYAFDSNGAPIPGWPVFARSSADSGGRIIHSPCIADLDGDGKEEVIVTTNEARAANNDAKQTLMDAIKKGGLVPKELLGALMSVVTTAIGKECYVYAIKPEGSSSGGAEIDSSAFVKGWPVAVMGLLPDLIPQIGPGDKPAAYDYDGDGRDEVVAQFMSAKAVIIDGNGKILNQMDQSPMGKNATGVFDKSFAANAFANPVIGDITGNDGGRPEIATGGVSLMFVLNLILPGQNFPYNHLIEVWDTKTGDFLDAYPRAIDDFVYSDLCLADVSGDAIPDVVAGSGLYLLHAFGADGKDKPGFPKLTGGWIMQSPCAADIDNDRMNEVACVTREGWIFVWDTPGKYSKVPSWPANGHDNLSSSNSGVDAVAPAAVTDIEIYDDGIQFTCPGDDGYEGQAVKILVYGSNAPIDTSTVNSAALLAETLPKPGGEKMFVKLDMAYRYYAAVAVDDAGNLSQLPISPTAVPVSPEGSGGSASDSDSDDSGWCFIKTSFL